MFIIKQKSDKNTKEKGNIQLFIVISKKGNIQLFIVISKKSKYR